MTQTLESLLETDAPTDAVLSVFSEYSKSAAVNPAISKQVIEKYAAKFSAKEGHTAYTHYESGMSKQLANGFPGLAIDYFIGMNQLAAVIAGKDPEFDTRILDQDAITLKIKKLLVEAHSKKSVSHINCAIYMLQAYAKTSEDIPEDERRGYKAGAECFKPMAELKSVSLMEFNYQG